MEYNKFEINSFTTNDIDTIPVESGHINLDSYYEGPWRDTLTHVIARDLKNSVDITQGDILYTNGEPSNCVAYEDIDTTKYYWDTLHQKLYLFILDKETNPWYVPYGTFKAVNGLPPMVVNTHIEFDPDAYYFNKLTDFADIYAWSEERDWYIVQKVYNLDLDPVSEYVYDIDTLDKTAYYYNRVKDEIYGFSYGVYFKEIDYEGTIKEKLFEFYDRLQENYIDISDNERLTHRSYIYISKHPEKQIVNPELGRVYYNTKENKMYVWDGSNYNELKQDNVIIPHIIFY